MGAALAATLFGKIRWAARCPRHHSSRMEIGYSALRKGRHSQTGQIYLVTFTTAGRRPHFSEWDVASDAARWLSKATNWPNAALLAWVLMPDHWHGLVEIQEDGVLSRTVGECKGRTARALRLRHPSLGPIWFPGFHDRAIRRSDDLKAAARYLLANPVRAGLVRCIGEYPYWDTVWL